LCFRRGGPNAGRRALVVHLLAKGSRLGYHGGSHHHDLPTTKGRRGLHELDGPALDEVGCVSVEREIPHGGLYVAAYVTIVCTNVPRRAIFDAGVGFEIKKGYAITYEFATVDIVVNWPKMILPNSPELKQKVEDMEGDLKKRNFNNIRMNFAFIDTTGGTKT
jgi:hypothetical protein